MSAQPEEKKDNFYSEIRPNESLSRRVNVNDLVSKMNEDKKKEK